MSKKVIYEEEISHEEENSEILETYGDDNYAPVITIYELLMNSKFIEIEEWKGVSRKHNFEGDV